MLMIGNRETLLAIGSFVCVRVQRKRCLWEHNYESGRGQQKQTKLDPNGTWGYFILVEKNTERGVSNWTRDPFNGIIQWSSVSWFPTDETQQQQQQLETTLLFRQQRDALAPVGRQFLHKELDHRDLNATRDWVSIIEILLSISRSFLLYHYSLANSTHTPIDSNPRTFFLVVRDCDEVGVALSLSLVGGSLTWLIYGLLFCVMSTANNTHK